MAQLGYNNSEKVGVIIMLLVFLIYTASSLVVVLSIIWNVLYLLGAALLFRKVGEPFWKAAIPFWGRYTEFSLSWIGLLGVIEFSLNILYFLIYKIGESSDLLGNPSTAVIVAVSILAAAAYVLTIMSRIRLSYAFGHGILFSLGLIFLGPVFFIILGLDRSEYNGNPGVIKFF